MYTNLCCSKIRAELEKIDEAVTEAITARNNASKLLSSIEKKAAKFTDIAIDEGGYVDPRVRRD